MKERLVQFIDYKGLSIRKFCIEVGISHNLIGNNSALGSDKLVKIWDKYQEINLDWVLTGRGEMLHSDATMIVGVDREPAQIAVDALRMANDSMKDRLNALQDKLIMCMEERDKLRLEHQFK